MIDGSFKVLPKPVPALGRTGSKFVALSAYTSIKSIYKVIDNYASASAVSDHSPTIEFMQEAGNDRYELHFTVDPYHMCIYSRKY